MDGGLADLSRATYNSLAVQAIGSRYPAGCHRPHCAMVLRGGCKEIMENKTKRVLAGVGGLFAVLGVVAVAFLALALWVARESPGTSAEIEKAREEGVDLGTAGDPSRCLAGVPARVSACREQFGPLDCRFVAGEYLGACLTRAEIDEEFCRGIPLEKDEQRTLAWAQGICRFESGFDVEVCRRALYSAQYPCDVRFPLRHNM